MKIPIAIALLCFCSYATLNAQVDTIWTIPNVFIHEIESPLDAFFDEKSDWKKLTSELEDRQYLLIGENHGVHESTKLVQWLSRLIQFDLFVTEIDSLSLRLITRHGAKNAALLKDMPGANAMYSYIEELELLASLEARGVDLIGIDLIHPSSFRLIMFELLKDEGLKSKHEIQRLIKLHNQDVERYGFFRIKTLKKSRNIWQRINEREYQGLNPLIHALMNHAYPASFMSRRAIHMRNKLSQMVDFDTLTSKKVLFKFGGSHLRKGLNTAEYLDIGNFISKMNIDSYFLQLIPMSGASGWPFATRGISSTPINLSQFPHDRVLSSLYRSCCRAANFSFINIKGFKDSLKGKEVLSPAISKLIENYDGVLFINHATPSSIH